MADLAPVAGHVHPAEVVLGVAGASGDGGHERLVPDAFHQGGAKVCRKGVVEPVVGNGRGDGDLRHVEEVVRVPVLEGADVAGKGLGGEKIPFLPGHPPRIGEEEHPADGLAAYMVHLFAGVQFELEGRALCNLVALCEDHVVDLLPARVSADVPHQLLFLSLLQEKPRVLGKSQRLKRQKKRQYDREQSH